MSQQLVMTPQLQQAIKLLQLSRMDLVDVVRNELMENPMLDEASEITATEAKIDTVAELQKKEATADTTKSADDNGGDKARDQIDWEAYIENYSSPTPGLGPQRLREDDLPGVEATLTRPSTLFDHLMWQLQLSDFSDQEREVAVELLGNIDDDGYFSGVTLEQVAEVSGHDVDYVQEVLELIQEFDPVGVGARDLRECLLIQVRFFELGSIVEQIVGNHLDKLEKKNYQAIAKAMEIDIEEVIEAARLIANLEPRPGRPFESEEPRYITPDIYVRKIDGEYVTVLNEDGMPKLKISNFYRNVLKSNSNGDTKKYVTEKLNSAHWLIKSIQQRQRTIVKVTESIVKFQRDFFERGVEYLKPLILRDVADDIGMHESTVSRVTNNKYVHTPQGIYELKYFFNSSINKTDGDNLASEAVKSKIRQLIGNEDPRDPHSDQKLVQLLKKDGIKIARRTVAKYREVMGILPSSKRKRLF
jgi:RNA polymerase sigma-54 factor